MSRKLRLPIIIISGLVLLLIVLNFVLPNFSLPRSGQESDSPVPTVTRESIQEIILNEDGFTPKSITIKVGETVSFINRSGTLATVNSNPHPTHNLYRFLNLGEFPDGNSVQVVLEEPGTFSYHNHINPDQQGTIVVE